MRLRHNSQKSQEVLPLQAGSGPFPAEAGANHISSGNFQAYSPLLQLTREDSQHAVSPHSGGCEVHASRESRFLCAGQMRSCSLLGEQNHGVPVVSQEMPPQGKAERTQSVPPIPEAPNVSVCSRGTSFPAHLTFTHEDWLTCGGSGTPVDKPE